MHGTKRSMVDWSAVVSDQAAGMTYAAILKKYKIASNTLARAKKAGLVPKVSISEAMQRIVNTPGYRAPRMGDEARKRTSIRMSQHNPGGRCKWYAVAGKKVQGTWERDFAILLERYGIMWIKPHNVIKYDLDEKVKSYSPDFYLPKFDLYVEIKGHWWGNDRNKMRAVIQQNRNVSIKILRKKELFETFIKSLAL